MPLKTVQQDTINNSAYKSLTDSIVQNDTNSLFLKPKNFLKEDAFIKKIKKDFDATSYYYSNNTQEVPIAPYFLNPKLFSVNKLSKQDINTVSSNDKSANNFSFKQSDILLFLLLFLASLLAYIRINTNYYIRQISVSVFSFAYSRTLFNERTKLFLFYDVLLLLVNFFTSGILIQMLLSYFGYKNSAIPDFLSIIYTALLVIILFSIYQILVRFIGMLSNNANIISEYLFYFNNSLKFLGIFNLIVVFILLYTTENLRILVIYFIFFVYISVYFIRIYKIFLDFLRNRFSLFYFILYFCALEIIPIMILLKHFSIL